MAVRLNLSRKYSEQYGEELARKVRLNLIAASEFGSTYGGTVQSSTGRYLKFYERKRMKFYKHRRDNAARSAIRLKAGK